MQDIPSAAAQFEAQRPVPAPVNPLELAGQALGLKQAQQGIQLNSVKLQQGQQALQDDQDIRAAAAQANGDPDKIYQYLARTNPRAADTFGQAYAARQKTEADTKKLQLDNVGKQNDMIGSIAGSVTDAPSHQAAIAKIQSQFGPQAVQGLGLDPNTYDPAKWQQIAQQSVAVKDQVTAHQKAQELQQKADEIATTKTKNDAEAADNLAKADDLRRKGLAETIMAAPDQETYDAVIQDYKKNKPLKGEDFSAIYPAQFTPAATAIAGQILGKVKSAAEMQQAATEKAAPGPPVPAKTPERQAQDIQEAQTRANTTMQDTLARENIMTGGNDPRLAAVPPNMRKDAVDSYGKAQDVFNKVANTTDNLKSTLDMAKSGNKEAQAAAPLVMVQTLNQLAEMKRLNPSEISNIKGAGSLIDSLTGRVGKIVAGKPIPDDIINDAQTLFSALSSNSSTAYQRSLASIDDRFRSKFASQGGAPPAAGGVAPEGTVITLQNGQKQVKRGGQWVNQ
jgi:hypothetical protein